MTPKEMDAAHDEAFMEEALGLHPRDDYAVVGSRVLRGGEVYALRGLPVLACELCGRVITSLDGCDRYGPEGE